MENTARVSEGFAATLEALREVVRRLRVNEDELHAVADWLNQVGAAGEFPLLFDVTLAITAVEAAEDSSAGTPANIEGPFYVPSVPVRKDGRLAVRPLGPDAAQLTVRGRLTEAADRKPVAGAEIDVWQADEHGNYDFSPDHHLRGVVLTDDNGNYEFTTVVPNAYTIPPDGPVGRLHKTIGRSIYRPAHIHYRIRVGGEQRLMTQFFIAGDKYLAADVAEAVRDNLVIEMTEAGTAAGRPAYELRCDVVLLVASRDRQPATVR